MFEFLSQFFTQILANFKVLPLSRKVSVVVVALGTMLGIVLLVFWTNRIDYQPLYFNLSPEDAGMVVEELKDQKIPYRLSANGRTVLVSSGKIYDLRLDLASRGIPSGGGVGFEIFDKTDLGTTEFVQKLNYQRALQGELARTINQFVEVEHSRVHITLPEKTLFLEDEQKSTASVVVKLRRKGALQERQVQGIVHLVAGSVERLEPENVTVVDVDGNVLSAGVAEGSELAGLTSSQREFQRELEDSLEKRVQTMLEKVVGKGKAIVRVTASLDLKQEEKTEEIFDPDSAVIRSEQRTEEKSKGNNPVAMGTPGVAANLPETGGAVTPGVSSTDVRKTNETMNYEINKVIRRIVEPTGKIKKLSVAVLLDGTYEAAKGEDGKEEYKYIPRTDEEMKKYESIVMKAVGYSVERGDQIEVSNIPFETVRLTDEEKNAMAREGLWRTLRKAILPLVTLLLVALLIVLVLRPLVQWLTRPSKGVGMVTGISAGKPSGELTGIPPSPLGEGATSREQITQLARVDAKRFAELLKNWISQR
jgi:flagellar M-ring protein FliF